jgi:thioredoxin 1
LTKVVLMDFFATWCKPCKMQEPILDELREKFEGKVEFKKIDIDASPELRERYNITAVPTLVIEKDGARSKRYVGVTNAAVLERGLNEALGI